ncbi:MAG: hypothetical protein CMA59_00330 [Euryarchaeota archaeon]|nr:hypothetical protein [Euryarchaeota archaeon]
MAVSKIRFFKMVTPPDGDTKTTVGNKTIAGTSFSTTISAINSLGATVNSIGVALKEIKNQQKNAAERAKRAQGLASDASRENKLEADKGGKDDSKTVAKIVGGGMGFLGNLMKFFKSLVMYKALDWLSDPKNRENIIKTFERIQKIWDGLVNIFTKLANWVGENWEKTFGEGNSAMEKLQGIAGLGGALAGLAFLTNPVGFIKSITGVFQMVGGGIMNLGKFLGGTVLGRASLALGQGVEAYQRVKNDESIAEEDREGAARGAALGKTTGALAGGEIGAKFLGPLGGIIGSALGGFLGENVGKFLGPIAGDFLNGIKDVFGVVMEWFNKLMEPLKDAVKEVFEALGPAMQTVVNGLKANMPFIEKVAGIMGKLVFGPLILMLKGLTALLKLVPKGGEMDELKKNAEENKDKPEKSKGGIVPWRSIGGIVPFNMDFKLPEKSKGGWIHGPQSGYPVSLTGKGVDFIGHGTEYVAQRSSGGFVIPVDTPHTRRDPSLSRRQAVQAKAHGYKVPGFSTGGQVNVSNFVNARASMPLSIGKPARSMGGIVNLMQNTAQSAASAYINNAPAALAAKHVAIPAAKGVGRNLQNMMASVKTAAGQVRSSNLGQQMEAMIQQALVLPPTETPGEQVDIPIIHEGVRNPASEFLVSRFGRTAETSNPVSNFL